MSVLAVVMFCLLLLLVLFVNVFVLVPAPVIVHAPVPGSVIVIDLVRVSLLGIVLVFGPVHCYCYC